MDSSCAPDIVEDIVDFDKTKKLVIFSSSDLLHDEREVRREVLRNMRDEVKGLEQNVLGCNQRKP